MKIYQLDSLRSSAFNKNQSTEANPEYPWPQPKKMGLTVEKTSAGLNNPSKPQVMVMNLATILIPVNY